MSRANQVVSGAKTTEEPELITSSFSPPYYNDQTANSPEDDSILDSALSAVAENKRKLKSIVKLTAAQRGGK